MFCSSLWFSVCKVHIKEGKWDTGYVKQWAEMDETDEAEVRGWVRQKYEAWVCSWEEVKVVAQDERCKGCVIPLIAQSHASMNHSFLNSLTQSLASMVNQIVFWCSTVRFYFVLLLLCPSSKGSIFIFIYKGDLLHSHVRKITS